MREKLVNLVARLSCGHDHTILGIRSDHIPAAVHCKTCDRGVSVDKYVDNRNVVL
jgi:hypothetical protein